MANKKYTSDIFVSYATEDFEHCVSDIFMALYETGVTSSWFDRLIIKPGDSIPQKIDEGLSSTRYLLPIITNAYFKKPWTQAELNAVKMLLKPSIPIWVDVTAKQVGGFSPTLLSQKAIIYNSNPYDVAEQVGDVLLSNKRTHFYKNKSSRDGATLFWQACYLYVLDILNGVNVDEDEKWSGVFVEPDASGATMTGNIKEALELTDNEITERADFFRYKATKLENKISNEDIAHLICGDVKRKEPWFPHEPREQSALKKVGYDSF